MRSLLTPALALSLSLLLPPLLTACDEGAPSVAAEDFARAYADALCGRAERCYNLAPHLVEQCRAETLEVYGDDIVKGIAAGRLVYDEALAGECVAGVAATRCIDDEFDDDTLAACLGALAGTLAAGETCHAAFECEAGFCGGSAGAACPSVCPEVLGEGEGCSLLSGPSCDERAGLRCSGAVCVRPAGEGAACVDRNGCQSPLVCGQGKCSPLREEGEGCAGDSSCADGLFCEAGGDEGGVCHARAAEGEACGAEEDEINAAFKGTQCDDGLVCKGAGLRDDGTVIPGVCTRPSPEGGACQAEPEGLQIQLSGCLEGLVCPSGKCEVPPSTGPCEKHGVCRQDVAYCDAETSTCMAFKATGDACAIPPECGGGVCENGVCADAVTYCHEG